MSTKKNESPKASIWKTKGDKLVDTAPSDKSKTAASSKKDATDSSSKNRNRDKKSEKKEQPKFIYQPKLMIEEDLD